MTEILIVLVWLVSAAIAFLIGKYDGETKSREIGLKSLHETMNQLYEAQKEAGVTTEQFLKINQYIAQKLSEEAMGLLKDANVNKNQ